MPSRLPPCDHDECPPSRCLHGGKCVYCGGDCADGDCTVVFTPIADCEHKDPVDGTCRNPKNMTPECHVGACPRLHPRIKI